MQIKYLAQVIVISIATVTSALQAYAGYSSSSAMIESAKRKELQTTATLIQNSIAEQSAKAAARASMTVNLPSIQQAFRKGDREELMQRLGPAYIAQRDQFGVREAQFHLAPAISFLRVYAPEAGHGEDLSSFREMVLATNRHTEPQRGIEIGRRGLSIRGIYPIKDEQGTLGSFEVGMDFDNVLKDCKKTTGYEAGVFVDDKLMTKVATLNPKPDPERVIGGFQNVSSTDWAAIRPMVNPELLNHVKDVTVQLQSVKGTDFGEVLVPMLDYKGVNIGSIVAVRNFSEYQLMARWALVGNAAMAGLQIILLAGALLMVINGMLLRPLAALDQAIGKLAKGEEAPDLAELAKQPGELGSLAKNASKLRLKQSAEATVPASEVKTHA
ncbi:MAG: hypothetical protein JWM80_6273 [Cyanobacteria bacterium RYN_339]|nr:hypothetical protein [Cyanobacteria bacterium RYN_339]